MDVASMHRFRNFWLLALPLLLSPWAAGHAETTVTEAGRAFVLQGSTTFTHRVMEPYQAAIEAQSGHKLTVQPTKSSRGLLALFEKSGDFAMISGPLQNEVAALKSNYPDLPYGKLEIFNVVSTRMAFAVNRDNPVRRISDDAMRRILLGEISNWREVGGSDLPIMVVMVREGGGVGASIEGELLGGKSIKPAKPMLVQASPEVIKMTAMIPGALGLSQLSMVSSSDLIELKTDRPIEQHLDLVTLGDPTPEMRKVIDAARDIMSKAASK
jgi:phosphate transport system substrate-binding protein